ncbi:MAG: 5'/3'-nucleotidase SurE [Prosthecobacter sp.]
MHFLLTNDDGIDAPGLAALEKAVRMIPGARVSIVAPADEQSMCGHRITTHSPLKVLERGEQRWAVHGTPADCVRIGLFALDLKPDWVLSGVNAGGNLGQDIVISGTCAAAREATYHQVKAAAFSHYLIRSLAVDWDRVTQWTHALFAMLQTQPLSDGEYWCANYPHHPPGEMAMPALRHCQPARSPLKVSYARHEDGHLYNASYAERPRDEGSDVAVCFGGEISLCRVGL